MKLELGSFLKNSTDVDVDGYVGIDVNGRDCLIVENIVDSGQTLVKVSEKLKKMGARKI